MPVTTRESAGAAPTTASTAGSSPLLRALHVAALLSLAACNAPADNTRGAAGDDLNDTADGDPRDTAVSVTDATGRAVTLPGPARRVASMMPAVTEWIIAMGAADRLVARTDYDDHPDVAHLPSVGGGLTPSIEWLADLRPDLVIAWPDAPSRSIVSRLEQVGVPVYAAPVESVDEALSVAADLGTLLGESAAAARSIAGVRAGLDSVRSATAERERPEVLYLIGTDPLMAAGPGTFVDELITVAGGRNVLHDLRTRWPQLSLEEVVRRAPTVVIVGSARTDDPGALLRDRPGWRDVPAVRRGAIHAVDPDRANRPGPRLHEAAARLAELIHPPRSSILDPQSSILDPRSSILGR